MQAVVKLERSEGRKPTTGKPGKAKAAEVQLTPQAKPAVRNRALQLNFLCSFFPCHSPGGLGCLCVVSSMDLSLCTYVRATLKAVCCFWWFGFLCWSKLLEHLLRASSSQDRSHMGHIKMGHMILKHIQNTAVRNIFLSLNSVLLLHLCPSFPFLQKRKLSDFILPLYTTDLSIS